MSGSEVPSTPGSMIEAARRKRGLSREDLAERTKIPTAMLAALEADEYHRLSGPLYARSFLRACAGELGLDAAEVFAAYERHGGEPQRAPGVAPSAPEPVRIRRVGLPWGRLAAGGALLVVVGLAALRFAGRGEGEAGGGSRDGSTPVVAGQGAAPGDIASGDAATPGVATGAGAMGLAAAAPAPGAGAVPGSVAAPAGLPGPAFADGLTWPLVARLRLESPVEVACRRDGEADYLPVQWPAGGGAPEVPSAGVVAGLAYADGAGFVVYWGAVERLSLRLASATGADLAVNGEPRPLPAPADGGSVVVDVPGGGLQFP